MKEEIQNKLDELSNCYFGDGTDLQPEPLPELLAVMPFDYKFLPDCLQAFTQDITERMQCPPDFAAVNTYVMLASVIGCKIGIRPKRQDNWSVVPNLWGITIGGSGVMKSPNRSAVMQPLRKLSYALRKDAEKKQQAFDAQEHIEKMRKDARQAKIKKELSNDPEANLEEYLNKADSDSEQDSEQSNKLERPRYPRFITNDATYEALGLVLMENTNGILYEADELIGFFKSLDKQGQEKSRAFTLQAADGNQPYTFDRVIRGRNLYIKHACLSILGGIQPGVLGEYVRGAVAGGAGADGLLQRFGLMVYPDISPDYQYIDRTPNTWALDAMADLVKNLYELDPVAIGAIKNESDGIPYLHFDNNAQAIFIQWLTKLETRLRSGADHPAIVSHLSKYRKLVPSLALINHLVDHHDGSKKMVSAESLERAINFSEYLETHARRIYSHGTQPEVDSAKAVLAKLKAGKLSSPFSSRDIYRKCWAGIDTAKKAQMAIDVLLDYGRLKKEKNYSKGRPTVEYQWIEVEVKNK